VSDDPDLVADPPSPILGEKLWLSGLPDDLTWAHAHGIDVVVDVADPGPEPDRSQLAGIEYHKHALVDGDVPAARDLDRLVGRVVAAVRDGRRVLVHCTMGRNRSGLVTVLAVRELLGIGGSAALAWVRARRRRTVNNAAFAAYVEELDAPSGRTLPAADLTR
jgi:protein-tyrosine phosphatase